MKQSAAQTLARGTTILLVANTWNRAVDFLYRIYLVRLIGAEAIGAFQVIMPFYSLLLILGSAGIPAAVANLVAERRSKQDALGIERLMRLSLWLTALLGTAATTVMLLGAGPLTGLVMRDPRLHLVLLAVAPALLVVAVSSVYRGYFQGLQTMWPVALAQLVEQVVNVSVTLPLLFLFLPRGLELTLAGMGVGLTCGEIAGLVTLMIVYQRLQRGARGLSWRWRPAEEAVPETADVPAVFALAWPTTLARLLGSVSMMISAVLIPVRLMTGGFDRPGATALYGQLTGMAMTLVAFPTLITYALAYNLVPAISAAYARGDRQDLSAVLHRALTTTLLITLPSAALLTLLAASLTSLAFGTMAPALPLLVVAAASPFLHVEQVMTGVLQGLGKPAVALRNFAVGEGSSLVLVYFLVPGLGITGAALAWAIGFVLEAVLDFGSSLRLLKLHLNLAPLVLRPLLAVAPAFALLAWLGPGPLRPAPPAATLALTGLAASVYLLGLAALVPHQRRPGA